MKSLKNFEEYLKKGIVKKQSPDKCRAKFLIEESENTEKFLLEIPKKIGINDSNANAIIKIAYDVIMELIRARMLIKGLNSSGRGAHESEVAYLRELNFSEADIQFANQLRYFRNGILYYGKQFDKEYAEKVLNFLSKIKTNFQKLDYD